MPRVFIPLSMPSLAESANMIDVSGENLGQVIENLEQRFPGFKDRICQDECIRPGFAVAVAGYIATLGLFQLTDPDAEIQFLPAIGGG